MVDGDDHFALARTWSKQRSDWTADLDLGPDLVPGILLREVGPDIGMEQDRGKGMEGGQATLDDPARHSLGDKLSARVVQKGLEIQEEIDVWLPDNWSSFQSLVRSALIQLTISREID